MEVKSLSIAIFLLFFVSSMLLLDLSFAHEHGEEGDGDGDGDGDESSPSTPSTSAPCSNSQVNLSGLKLPFDYTSNFSCSNVWNSQSFMLMHQQTEPNLWSFILIAPDKNAYISVGFSPNGKMVGSSAVAGWVPPGDAGIVRQYDLQGTTSGSCPPDKGNLKLGKASIVSQSKKLYMAFQINATSPGKNLIYAVGPSGSFPGKDYLLDRHDSMASTTIDYTSGQTSASPSGESPNNSNSKSSSSSSPCNAKLGIAPNIIPFDTSALSCYIAWPSRDFTMFYKKVSSGLWSFVLSAPNDNAYISVGFSNNGRMVGSDAIAGWVSGTGGMAKKYYLGGEKSGDCPPDSGSLSLVQNKAWIVSQGSRLYLAFQLNTTMPKSNLIYAVGPNGNLPGSDGLLPEHRDMFATKIDYTTGVNSASESSSDTLKTIHGVFGLIGWGVLIPIGVMMARYFKHRDPFWFNAHISIQTIGFASGLTCVITGFSLEDKVGEEVDKHKSIGILILVLGCLQVMAFLARPDKGSKVRKYWNWYHHNVGRIAIGFAIVNIFYGLSLAHERKSWSIAFGVFLGLWVIVCMALEAKMRLRD